MSASKPRIKPKSGPGHQQREFPTRDAPPDPERDPPAFTETDPAREQKAAERVLFNEDDCLR